MELDPKIQQAFDQLAKLPAAVRVTILAGVGVMILAGYWFLVYQGTAVELEQLQAKELELERKLSEVRSIAANIEEFEEEIASLQIKLKSVLRQLPNKREIEVVLTDISNVAKSAGVEIREFRRRDEIVNGFYAEVPIDLSLEGRYHDIGRFFDKLARLPRIVNMGAIDVKVASDTIDGTILKVKGTATTFRFVGKDST